MNQGDGALSPFCVILNVATMSAVMPALQLLSVLKLADRQNFQRFTNKQNKQYLHEFFVLLK